MPRVARLKNGKAAGASGVLPEMVKAGGDSLNNKLVELFGDVWRAGQVPQEWVDATLVPIPKKGDLARCDNLVAGAGVTAADQAPIQLAGVSMSVCRSSSTWGVSSTVAADLRRISALGWQVRPGLVQQSVFRNKNLRSSY